MAARTKIGGIAGRDVDSNAVGTDSPGVSRRDVKPYPGEAILVPAPHLNACARGVRGGW